MLRPTKKQVNLKMPEALIKELKARAESQNDTFTDLVIRLCEQGLESESDVAYAHAKGDRPVAVTEVAPTISVDKHIADAITPLQERLVALETSLGELSA